MKERKGAVTIHGEPFTLLGDELKVGQRAPDFQLVGIDWKEVSLFQSRGKVRVISVVYSLDTSVCDLQTQRFESMAGEFKDDVVIFTISMDLPFAQARYCGAHSISNLKTLSDYRRASFGESYGLLIKEKRLLDRAIFVIDQDGALKYVEYVKEVSQHPDYDKVIAALKTLTEKKAAPAASAPAPVKEKAPTKEKPAAKEKAVAKEPAAVKEKTKEK